MLQTSRSRYWLLLVACLSSISHNAFAAAAHVHGRGVLQLAVDAGRVTVDLTLPAHDVLGFEHAPRTAAQRDAIARARTQLARATNILRFPGNAGCAATDAQSTLPGDIAAAGHGHEHGQRSDDGRHVDAHADVSARYGFRCTAPQHITMVDLQLFRTFVGVSEMRVQYVTDRRQGEVRARRAQPRVVLR